MKKESGITLVTLVIYIVAMMIVIGIMSNILNNFYNNSTKVQYNIEEIIKFNKFNMYFLKEIKKENKVDTLGENYISFSTGNSFSFKEDTIYYNDIKICDGIKSMIIQLGKNGDGIDQSIIYIQISFENFSKSMNYKIENIY